MLISVVIPTWKRPQLLQKCLEALTRQSFPRNLFEIIIVTDGPDQETKLMAALFEKQNAAPSVSVLALPQKKGPAAARNHGWRQANGELIAFTDDDCLPSEDWLVSFWEAYQPYRTVEIAFTGNLRVPVSQSPTDYEKNVAHLETADFVTANCACTKRVLEKIQGFDEEFEMAWREDSELEFKLINSGISIIQVPDAQVIHPVRKAPWGVSLKEQKKSMYNALLYKKHPVLYKQKISASPVWNYYGMIVLFFSGVLFLSLQWIGLGVLALLGWAGLELHFMYRRLNGTSKSLSHIGEMVITSLFIPVLSVYWTLYGAVKYKVMFL